MKTRHTKLSLTLGALMITAIIGFSSQGADDGLSHLITIQSRRDSNRHPCDKPIQIRLRNGSLQSSRDCGTWIDCVLPVKTFVRAVTAGQGQMVAVGGSYFDVPAAIITSPDALHWTRRRIPTASNLYGVTFGNGLFVAVGQSGAIFTSPNGADWTRRRSTCTSVLLATVTFGNGRFVAGGDSGTILTSTNGLQWSRTNLDAQLYIAHIAFTNGRFLVRGPVAVFSSADAFTWERRPVVISSAVENNF